MEDRRRKQEDDKELERKKKLLFDTPSSPKGKESSDASSMGGKENSGIKKKQHSRMEQLLGPEGELDERECQDFLDSDMDALDITNEEMDFEELDSLISIFNKDARVQEALTQGVDLRAYTLKVEQDLLKVETSSVGDYVAESENFETLHSQITACDEILESMEKMLSGFQSDLGNISDEIKFLQAESSSISVKLNNRRKLESKLSTFVDGIVISKALVNGICITEVNEAYLAFLTELNKKLNFVDSIKKSEHERTGKIPLAVLESEPHIINLRNKAVGRIREFLLHKIYNLSKPKTNIQILQETTFVKYKYFYSFLATYADEVASEVHQNYVNTMSKIYATHFSNYIQALGKLSYPSGATRNDMLATPEAPKGGGSFVSGLFGGGKVDLRNVMSVFCLGNRREELDSQENSIVPHVAVQLQQKFPYEVIFRSYNQLLVDSITNEWKFYNEFFGDEVSKKKDIFGGIFGSTIQLFLENVDSFLATCYDALGLLLMLRVTVKNRDVMSKIRGINIGGLDEYFRQLRKKLLERFTAIVTMNADSLDRAELAELCVDTKTKLSTPHYVTRRYAEFATAINSINSDLGSDKKVEELLALLRGKMEALLVKMADHMLVDADAQKNKHIFFINNYDLVLSVLAKREIFAADRERFTFLLDEKMASYVTLQLSAHYQPMLAFVAKTKANSLKGIEPDPEDARQVGQLLSHFSSTWKSVIPQLSNEVMTNFSNFQIGGELLKQIFTQLTVVYGDLSEIVRQYYKALAKDVVPRPTLTYEIKKYTRSFD